MKKLLILVMVLGVASMANATLQISVDGDPEPIDSEIVVTDVPSGILTLDIWTDAAIAPFTADTIALICTDDRVGTVDGSGYTSPIIPPLNLVGQVEDAAFVQNPPGSTGPYGGFLAGMGGIAQGAVLYDDILFHCEGPGDAVLELWGLVDTDPDPVGENWVFTTLYDTVIVHQVPEPMTMALLGLGGLFLRRRK